MADRDQLTGVARQPLRGLSGLVATTPRKKGGRDARIGSVPLLAWWDAQDLTTMTYNGAAVSSWTDKVGGRVVDLRDGGSPLTRTTYGGFATLSANNAGLSNADLAHGLPLLSAEAWVFGVSQSRGTAGGVFAYGHGQVPQGNGWSGAGRGVSFNYSGGQYCIAHHSNMYMQSAYPGGNLLAVQAGRFTPSQGVELWYDGQQIGANPDAVPYTDVDPRGVHMGNREYINGCAALGDCIVTGPLKAADRQYLEGYLHWKYGLQGRLPTDHPYRSARP